MAADGSIPLPTLDDIGHEQTFEGYQDHVVRRDFRALRRVLRDNGVLVVVVDDVIANPGSIYRQQTYHHARDQQKLVGRSAFVPRARRRCDQRGIGWVCHPASPRL